MSKVGKWSQTAANNNSAPPDGWPEQQAPSTVNDCGREMMAAVRALIENADYIDYDVTPSYLSATTFSLSTADSKFEVGRRIKLFDTQTLYGTINSVSATFVSVRLDAGALTGSLSSCALGTLRASNPAIPDPIYQPQNIIINGAFDFWQRTSSAAGVTNFQYVADRFKYEAVNSASVNIYRLERSANAAYVPSIASCGAQLNSSMNVYVSATDASIASADYAAITYIVEGFDWRQIAHKPMGLSFQVNSNKSGIYSLAIRSSSTSKSFVQNYTISTINTWQRVFMAFPEAPTDVTWDYSSGAGLYVTWTLASGGNYSVSAGAWTAANALHSGNQVNFLANAGNAWALADVRLKTGSADTPVALRPFALEQMCVQRYYETGTSTVYFTASGAEEHRNSAFFASTKRVIPTISLASGAQTNVALAQAVNARANRFDHRVVSSGAGTTADDSANWAADAEI